MATPNRIAPTVRSAARAPVSPDPQAILPIPAKGQTPTGPSKLAQPAVPMPAKFANADAKSAAARKKYYSDQAVARSKVKQPTPASKNPLAVLGAALGGPYKNAK